MAYTFTVKILATVIRDIDVHFILPATRSEITTAAIDEFLRTYKGEYDRVDSIGIDAISVNAFEEENKEG